MRKFIICCLLLGQCLCTNAQSHTFPLVFSSINNVALVVGESRNALTIQSKNGLKKDRWFAGIGTGFDFYAKRTIPLHFSLQRDFFAKPQKLFVYADAGINFRWLESTDYLKKSSTSTPGLYYEWGLGCKIKFKNTTALLFSAGYNLKQVKEKVNPYWFNPNRPINEDDYEKYNYYFRRIVIRLGLQL